MLAISGLSYAYGQNAILDGIDLTVAAGEITCLVGPNGVGKSTLLKCIVGIRNAAPGRMVLAGRPIEHYGRRERARAISYVPQHAGPALSLHVVEMVALGRAPHRGRSSTARDREIVWNAIERLDLASLAFRPFLELSGGQRQRVLIARAIAQDSRLMLMDEPTSNLDPFYQLETLSIIRAIADADGMAMLVTLHDLSLAARLADQVAMMRAGRIVARGAWRDVLTPANIAATYGVDAIVGTQQGLPYVIAVEGTTSPDRSHHVKPSG